MSLPAALEALGAYRQFILCRFDPDPSRPGKTNKIPMSCATGAAYVDAHDPANWTDASTAYATAAAWGERYGVAFVLTDSDPFFCLDIDGCLTPTGWSEQSLEVVRALPGCAVEVSNSGTGLHLWGTYQILPAHRCRDTDHRGAELYHELRFIALGRPGVSGSIGDCTAAVQSVISRWFNPGETGGGERPAGTIYQQWEAAVLKGPDEGYEGPADDDALIARMLSARQSAAASFGSRATLTELWEADPDALGRVWPDATGKGRPYDPTYADAALAAHLAFWTGRDCERIRRLMERSALRRDKWEREDYLPRTILGAVARVSQIYKPVVREPQAAPVGSAEPAPAGQSLPFGIVDARDGIGGARPLSELGNAWRLFDRHGADLRYVMEPSAWLHWSGGAWSWDRDGAVPRTMAADVPAQLYAECGGPGMLSHAEHYVKWARESQKYRTVRNAVGILSDIPAIRLPLGHLNHDGMVVGLDRARRVLDLRTGEVRAATQGDYVTKSLGVSEVGRADGCPRWLKFLGDVFQGDAQLIDWVQRWCGYLLTGDTSEHCFVFAHGGGRNGKGTFAETLKHVMGDYGRIVAPETLQDARRAAGAASPDVVALVGARLALSSETEDGAHLAENLIKLWTGGDTLTGRALHSAPIEFKPAFKLMVLGNHKPVIRGVDLGIWSRVRLVPFLRTFAAGERDTGLPAALRAEGAHILAWMLEGCRAWQARGLSDAPAAVQAATESYRSEMDILGQWMAEHVETDPNGPGVQASLLYANYKAWAVECGLRPITAQNFGRRMSDRGIHKLPGRSFIIYTGVKLKV